MRASNKLYWLNWLLNIVLRFATNRRESPHKLPVQFFKERSTRGA